MSKEIKKTDFFATFPQALKKDKKMLVLGKIITEELNILENQVDKNIIYNNIDNLSEKWLDVLAYDLHIDWYDYNYEVEIKRKLVKESVKIHAKMGTKFAVEKAVGSVYGGAKVTEWFEYEGEPFCFKILVEVLQKGITKEETEKIKEKMKFYKNERSHCENISYRIKSCGTIKIVSCLKMGIKIKINKKEGVD